MVEWVVRWREREGGGEEEGEGQRDNTKTNTHTLLTNKTQGKTQHRTRKVSSPVLLAKICPRRVITCFRGSHFEFLTTLTFRALHGHLATKRVVMDVYPRLFEISSLLHSEHCTETNMFPNPTIICFS